MADTPEESNHTSVQQRAQAAKAKKAQPKSLCRFVGNPRKQMPQGLPFRLVDYLALVDETGRQIRQGKRGHIAQSQSPSLKRLNIEPENWLTLTTEFEDRFSYAAGDALHMRRYRQNTHHRRLRGMQCAVKLFG